MSNWHIIIPAPTANLFVNPQHYTNISGWTVGSDGVPDVTYDTTYTFIGNWSRQLGQGAGASYIDIYQAFTCTATSYTLSCRVRRNGGGTVSDSECQAKFDSSDVNWDSITEERDGWHLCIKTDTATAGAGRQFGVHGIEDDLRVDAFQLENLAYRTTYCDGTRPGCKWTGAEHESQSFRDANERSGGRVYDFDTDYSMPVENFIGTGMASVTVRQRSLAVQRGSVYQGTRANSSNSTLTFWVNGSTVANLHSLRQDLIDAMKPDAGTGDQLFMIRYTGAAVHKERGHAYEGGLELANWAGFNERIPIRIMAPDPAWLGLGEESDVLDDQDSMTARCLHAREDDTWIDFGPPNAAGTYTDVRAIESARTYSSQIYVGGDFVNLDNQANCDYIAQFDTEAETWAPMGTGMSGGTGVVRDIVRAGDNVWAGGSYTSAGGVANTQYISYWDISGGNWTSVGNANNSVYGVCYASDGSVYVTGAFTSIGGVAMNRVGYYDTSGTWNAMGTGLNGQGEKILEGPDGYIYCVGAFTLAGGVANTSRVAYWDGSAWNPLGTGCGSNTAFDLCFDDAGDLYIVGTFASVGGVTGTADVAMWNGAEWFSLDGGVTSTGLYTCDWIDGQLYVGGQTVTLVGSSLVPTSNRARWNGSAWTDIDWDAATTHIVWEISHDDYGNVYYGHDESGTIYYSGKTTVTNSGTMAQRPLIWFDSAVDTKFLMLRNIRTGAEIWFDMDTILTTDEKVYIDLRDPQAPTVTSDIKGNQLKTVIPGSVLTSFELLPGDNDIEAYGYNGTAGTTSTNIYALWVPAYWSTD